MLEDAWWAMEMDDWAPKDEAEVALKAAIALYQAQQLRGQTDAKL
jgi:hypothetical protein